MEMAVVAALGWGLAAVATATGVAGATVLRRRERALATQLMDERVRSASLDVRDTVTGSLARPGLDLLGGHLVASAKRRGDSVHVVVVDVWGLDAVQDRLGQPARDAVLAAVAASLRRVTREADVVGRLSPGRFAVIAATGGIPPAELERRLRVDLWPAPPVPRSEWPCLFTAGAGVLEPWDSGQLDDVLHLAARDAGLRRALRSPSAPERDPSRP
jgi:GGDEF domain-containing protein